MECYLVTLDEEAIEKKLYEDSEGIEHWVEDGKIYVVADDISATVQRFPHATKIEHLGTGWWVEGS